MRRHLLPALLLAALTTTLLLATGCADERTAEQRSGKLVYGFDENMKTFDPAHQVYAQESTIIHLVLETLVRWSDDLVLEPWLAESWEVNEDCSKWTFHLRPDVRFHDGTPLTSAAFKSQFERLMDPETAATRANRLVDIGSIEAPDDLTLVFNLANPNCVFAELLASTWAAVYSPAAFEKYGADIARNPVGTGPFTFVSWDQTKMEIALEKNPDYWRGDVIAIERLDLVQVKENTTRLTLLEQGMIDVGKVSAEHVPVARGNPDVQLMSAPYLAIVYIGFNCQRPPFDDVRVRQACNYAVNKQDMIEFVFFGVGEPAKGPFPTVLPAFNDEIEYYDYNPEKARALLKEAGYENGVDVVMWTQETGSYRKISEATVGYLKEVGVNVEMVVYDNGVYWDKFDEYMPITGERYPLKDGCYDMYVGGWAGGEAPQYFLEPLFMGGSYSNASFYDVPEVNRLLMEVKNYPDPADRDAAFKRLQEIIVGDAPWIFGYYSQQNVGVRNRVKGFKVNTSGWLRLEGVTLEDE
ncbi:MAG: peptide/nickel transport system substrate-binding protein [Candidatus Sumerlaeota bacterium]|nr:peptide/nickel transport system substrate-binding protein [Candidatus Sumerlaeota bacterium]